MTCGGGRDGFFEECRAISPGNDRLTKHTVVDASFVLRSAPRLSRDSFRKLVGPLKTGARRFPFLSV